MSRVVDAMIKRGEITEDERASYKAGLNLMVRTEELKYNRDRYSNLMSMHVKEVEGVGIANPDLLTTFSKQVSRLKLQRDNLDNPEITKPPEIEYEMSPSTTDVTLYLLQEGAALDLRGHTMLRLASFLSVTTANTVIYDIEFNQMIMFTFSCSFRGLSTPAYVNQLENQGIRVRLIPFKEAEEHFVSRWPKLFEDAYAKFGGLSDLQIEQVAELVVCFLVMLMTKNINSDNAGYWKERRIETLGKDLHKSVITLLNSFSLNFDIHRIYQQMMETYYPMMRIIIYSIGPLVREKSSPRASLYRVALTHMEYAMMTNLMLIFRNILDTNFILLMDPILYKHIPDLMIAVSKCELLGESHKFARLLFPMRSTKWTNTASIRELGNIARIVGMYNGDRKLENIKGYTQDEGLTSRIFHTLSKAEAIIFRGALKFGALTFGSDSAGFHEFATSFTQKPSNKEESDDRYIPSAIV